MMTTREAFTEMMDAPWYSQRVRRVAENGGQVPGSRNKFWESRVTAVDAEGRRIQARRPSLYIVGSATREMVCFYPKEEEVWHGVRLCRQWRRDTSVPSLRKPAPMNNPPMQAPTRPSAPRIGRASA